MQETQRGIETDREIEIKTGGENENKEGENKRPIDRDTEKNSLKMYLR